MYSDTNASFMTESGDDGPEMRPGRHRVFGSGAVAMMLLVLLALALVASESRAGEPEAALDRAALLADFRASTRPDVTSAAREVLGEIQASALADNGAPTEALRAASVQPAPAADAADDVDDLYVEVTARRRPVVEVVASNDESLRF